MIICHERTVPKILFKKERNGRMLKITESLRHMVEVF